MIIAFQPYAIFDIALWLSALATLGLLLLSSLLNKRGKKGKLPKRILKGITSASLASIFAISASIVISLLFFDGFSVLALPTTLALSVLTEILIYLSLFTLAFGYILPAGGLLLFMTNLTFNVAEWFSKFDYALIPFDFILTKTISVILAVVFFTFLLFVGKKHRKIAIITITAIFTILNLTGICQSAVVKNNDTIIYTPGESCNVLTVRSNNEYTVIASGGGRNDTFKIIDAAAFDKITKIDRLIIPSYTYYSIDIVSDSVSELLIDIVVLPEPQTTEECDYALYIAQLLSEFDTKLIFINDDEGLEIGEYTFTLHSHSQPGGSVLLNSYSLTGNDTTLFYLSRGCLTNGSNPNIDMLDRSDTIIVGSDKYSNVKQIDFSPKSVKTVIFGGKFNLSTETDNYLKEKGASVIYTDTPINID